MPLGVGESFAKIATPLFRSVLAICSTPSWFFSRPSPARSTPIAGKLPPALAARRPATIEAPPGHARAPSAVQPFGRAPLRRQWRIYPEADPQAGDQGRDCVTNASFLTALLGFNPPQIFIAEGATALHVVMPHQQQPPTRRPLVTLRFRTAQEQVPQPSVQYISRSPCNGPSIAQRSQKQLARKSLWKSSIARSYIDWPWL